MLTLDESMNDDDIPPVRFLRQLFFSLTSSYSTFEKVKNGLIEFDYMSV